MRVNSGEPSARSDACRRSPGNKITQPLVIVHTLPAHHVPPYPPRLVVPNKFRGDGEHDGVSGAARLTMNVILLIKFINIRWLVLMAANFGR